ncbi:MAG: glycerol kinase [Legionella longbeachae]|nr:glycerol kinase [Legionella longbeachae]
MNYLLAIDQGTSSTRAMLYTLHGILVASSQYPLNQNYPKPGWVEHDPEEIWQKTLAAMRDVVAQFSVDQIISCGLTNQRETTVIWNKETGACLSPAIVWQDRRTAEYCQTLIADKFIIQEKTGLIPDPYFSATKLKWLLENIPEATQLAKKGELAFGTIDSFLIWRLTKEHLHLTDVTNASRTMLFNIKSEQWDLDLLEYFAIPESILPKVCASDDHFGMIDKKWLGAELAITGVAGDQQTSSDETEILASSLEGNDGVYLVSAFTGLGAPHWISTSGAIIVGLSLSSNRAHFARAALEGVCYQTREICFCMREDSQLNLSLLRVDGGMAANRWFLQFLADQCQMQVQKPKDIETTAKGAAILAAIGCGIYNSLDEVQAIWDAELNFRPQRSLEQVEMDYRGWTYALNKM